MPRTKVDGGHNADGIVIKLKNGPSHETDN